MHFKTRAQLARFIKCRAICSTGERDGILGDHERGVLIKAIEDAALSMACILRSVKVDLPTQMPLIADETIGARIPRTFGALDAARIW